MRAGTAAPLYQVLADARRRLVASGIAAPEATIEVNLFARTVLGWDQARLITAQSSPAPDGLEPRFSDLVLRRTGHEPVAYILEGREFWGLDFRVTPDVLVPRPETEFIVEEALSALAAPPASGVTRSDARIADIGTGSGCIAVSLAHELPGSHVVATDVSAAALGVARFNAERHRVSGRVACVATSYLDGVAGMFDLIAANPPYVREGDKPALASDVRYEPEVALFGGATGLRHVEGVLDTAAARLRPGGCLVMEFGFGQEEDVRGLVTARPALQVERVREDLQGIARTAVVRRVRL